MKPYQYQVEAIEGIQNNFKLTKRVILCLPTGAGKTVTFAAIGDKIVSSGSGKRVMYLTETKKLLPQISDTLREFNIWPVHITATTRNPPRGAQVYVAMAMTVINRIGKEGWEFLEDIDLFICDEAHMGIFKRLMEAFPERFFIGATATPYGGKDYEMRKWWGGIVETVSIPALISLGRLTPCRHYSDENEQRRIDNALKIRNGEYTSKSQGLYFDDDLIYRAIKKYADSHRGEKCIIYCPSVAHTKRTHELFKAYGLNAGCVYSGMKEKEKDAILERFAEGGDLDVMVNCGILTKGYDNKAISVVMLLRKTTSLPLYIQMIGRGGRALNGKSIFHVYDYGLNVFYFQTRWDDLINWTAIFKDPSIVKRFGDKTQPAPIKTCQGCGAIIPANTSICSFCGKVQRKKKSNDDNKVVAKKMEEVKVVPKFAGISRDVDEQINEWIQTKNERGYKDGWLTRKIFASYGYAGLVKYGKIKGYSSPEYWAKMKAKSYR